MKTKLRIIQICLSLVLLVLACSEPTNSNNETNNDSACTTEFVYGITVKVFDETESIVTDAIVKITDGDYIEILELQENDYIGAGERSGHYTLDVERSGYSSYSRSIKVLENNCHVNPESVSVDLEIG